MSDTVSLGPVTLPRRTVRWVGALVAAEAVLLGAYLVVADAPVLPPRYLLYPFVWVNVAVVAVARTTPTAATPRARTVALLVAGAYLAALAAVTGVVAAGGTSVSARVVWDLPPGWGPALLVHGAGLRVALFPYETVGYAALGYLVYATALEARALLGGVVGLASCVGCTLPVAAAAASTLLGGAAAAGVAGGAHDLSTAAFVASAVLLAR